ncbi:class I adenylate-forming enzyme family protein [Aeromicrobium sp. CTD01-1L150]|uniref:class I adenylate-forming enzyme family protein n=1 Tax=Aeromicrobium sp. CTD01-1L150 TaxID=3341830 RepID=UPI0035C1229C
MVNAVDSIWQHAERAGDRAALRVGDRTWTYADLRDQVSAWADRFAAAGVARGDRILLVAPSSAEYVPAYHGILAHGAVAVTVNSMSTAAELGYFLADSGSRLVIAAPDCEAAAREAVGPDGPDVWILAPGDLEVPADVPPPVDLPDDAGAVIMYTSGTTGRPKGAELSHRNIVLSGESVIEALGVSADDRWASALPLFHVFGQVTVMRTAFHAGASLSLLPKFDGRALLDLTIAHRITVLSGVPTMWNAMVNVDAEFEPGAFEDLSWAVSGGAGLPGEVSRAFLERFGCELLSGYGLTETAAAGACNRAGAPRKEGSVGIPWPGVEVRVLDTDRQPVPHGEVGEIAIRSEMVMKGYWNRPDATAEVMHDGWFLTGDLGKVDDEDYVWVVDRKKDLVIRGGYNVYPREVEEVLYEHPDILEAAVVGLPDDYLGEEIAAIIALCPGATFDASAMRAWVGERLSAYKVPRVYQVVDELPKGATGKILKRGIDRQEVRASGLRVERRPVG